MKLKSIFTVLALSTLCAHGAVLSEVSFLIQGDALSWFKVADPTVQGSVSLSGLPGSFDANALAYDSTRNRLIFTSGGSSNNPGVYSVELSGMVLSPGMAVAGTAVSIGNFSFGSAQSLLGGEFYNGAYYALRNDSDVLLRMTFDGSGNIASQTAIDLPGNNNMFLGDLAFDAAGNLAISGYNANGTSPSDDRLWRFSTSDGGASFTSGGVTNPAGDRFNGIGYSLGGTLYGYRTSTQSFGTIDPATGTYTEVHNGPFFIGSGDLSSGVMMDIIPEPSVSLLAGFAGLSLAIRRRRA